VKAVKEFFRMQMLDVIHRLGAALEPWAALLNVIVVMIALLISYRSVENVRKQTDVLSERLTLDRSAVLESRYSDAIKSLSDSHDLVKFGAVSQLRSICQEDNGYVQPAIDVLDQYIKQRTETTLSCQRETGSVSFSEDRDHVVQAVIDSLWKIRQMSRGDTDVLDLRRCDLRNIALTKTPNMDLFNVDFTDSILACGRVHMIGRKCKFKRSIIKDTNFTQCTFAADCLLQEMVLENVKFYNCIFKCSLSSIKGENVLFEGCTFMGCSNQIQINEPDVANLELSQCIFENSILLRAKRPFIVRSRVAEKDVDFIDDASKGHMTYYTTPKDDSSAAPPWSGISSA
jgi:uncharacterized protein YjbI with pentapeptide repeats